MIHLALLCIDLDNFDGSDNLLFTYLYNICADSCFLYPTYF